ncbi:MAG TPA: ABC transporter permease [Chloroflexi bacterium]|jgi:Cu-processing system permease protein|nr:ABC transporter permease [Chloroflexota bacterium]
MDLENILTLTQKELRDARRNRWFILYTVAFAGLALALAWLALSGVGTYGLAGFGRTGASLINLVLLIVPLMGLTLGAMSLAGERERGTLLYLFTQPIAQIELLLGKFIGLALAMLLALLLGFGLSGLLIAWQGGATQAEDYLLMMLLAFILALVSLSLGFLISAAVGKSATAVGLALFLWLLLVFFGDLGLMGTAIVLRLDIDQLFTLALLNPLQLFKMAAILAIRSNLEVLGPAGTYAVRTYGSQLMVFLIAVLAVWALLPLAITHYLLGRRGVL